MKVLILIFVEYKSEREDLVTSLDAAKVRIAELENALAKKVNAG